MLEIKNINCFYGEISVLHDFSLQAKSGEVTCMMGRNGAGKTTCLKAIMGLVPIISGAVKFDNVQLNNLAPHDIPKQKIGYVPQGRRLFSEMTVLENIQIGLGVMNSGADILEKLLNLFPKLRERLKQRAGTLSGGEQQMLAMARALAIEPQLLLLDEPTEGLQPSMVELIGDVVLLLKKSGVAVLLVEQKLDCVLALADKVAFVENGYSREMVDVKKLSPQSNLLKKYIGV